MATINAIGSDKPIEVAFGGTGIQAAGAAYAPICAGTTTTGALQTAATSISSIGTSLISNGSAALSSWAPLASMKLLSTVTLGAGTSFINFNSSVVTSAYKNYFVIMYRITPAASRILSVTFSTNNGSTFLSSYFAGANKCTYNSTTFSNANSTTTGQLGSGNISGNLSGYLMLYNLQATVSHQPSWCGQLFDSNSSSWHQSFGCVTTSTAVNYIRFGWNSTNFNVGGSISLYGFNQ